MTSRYFLIAVVLACAALGGCASTQEAKDNNDPLEPFNRTMFGVNTAVEKFVAVPVAEVYVTVIPKPVRTGLHNALNNLSSPVTFGNDVLQGEPERALQTFYRFGINSTLGLGGIFDIAALEGVPSHKEDFGQTLGVYGVGEGPYLMLPLVGPSPPRDLFGHFVDIFMDPLYYLDFHGRHALLVGRHITGLVDSQAQGIDAFKQIESSADPYAAARSGYRQHRDSEIRNGAPDTSHLPDISDVPPTGGFLQPILPNDSK